MTEHREWCEKEQREVLAAQSHRPVPIPAFCICERREGERRDPTRILSDMGYDGCPVCEAARKLGEGVDRRGPDRRKRDD